MSKLITTKFLSIIFIFIFALPTFAGSPLVGNLIHFAGRLTDKAGNAKPTASIQASIYTEAFIPVGGTVSAGNRFWNDTFNDVVVSGDGTFSIMLGSGNPLNLAAGELYYLVLNVDWSSSYVFPPDRIFGDDSPAGDLIIINSFGLQTGDTLLGLADSITVGGTAAGGILTLDEFGGTGGALSIVDSAAGDIMVGNGGLTSVTQGSGNFLLEPDLLLVQNSTANTTVTGDSMTLGDGTTTGASLNVYASSTTGGDVTINGGATSGGGTLTIGAGTVSGGGSLTIAGAANDVAGAGTLIIDGDSDSSPISFSDGDLMMGSFGNPADVTIDGYVGVATGNAASPALAVSHLGANDALSVTGSTTFDGSVEIITTASSNALVTNGTVEVTGGAVIAPMMSTELMNVGAPASPGNFMLFDGTDTDMHIWADGTNAGTGISMKRVAGTPIATAEIMLQTQGAYNGNLTFADTFNPNPITLTKLAEIGNGGGSREIIVDISGGVGQFTDIQTAITYALSLDPVPSAETPVVIFVNPGYYVVGATVELEPYIHIIGHSPESTRIAGGVDPTFSRSTSSGANDTVLANLGFSHTNNFLYVESGSVTVYNCHFIHNNGTTPSIDVNGAELIVFKSVFDINAAGAKGISVSNSGVVEISDSYIYGNGSAGFMLNAIGSDIIAKSTLIDSPSTAATVTCSSSGEIDISNCTITGNSSSSVVYLATNATFTARHSEIKNINGSGGDAVYSTYGSNDPNVPNASLFSCLLEVAIDNQLTSAAANTYYLAPMCSFIGGSGKTDANSEVVEQTTAPNREVVVDQYGSYPGSFLSLEEAFDYVENTLSPAPDSANRVAIIVKPGNYSATNTLNLHSYVDLIGTSPDSTVVTSSASPAISRNNSDPGECTIANLTINSTGGVVIDSNAGQFTIFNCNLKNTANSHVVSVYSGTGDVSVVNSRIDAVGTGASSTGVFVNSGSKVRIANSDIFVANTATSGLVSSGTDSMIDLISSIVVSETGTYAALDVPGGKIYARNSKIIGNNNVATEGVVKLTTNSGPNGFFKGDYTDLSNAGSGPLFYSDYTSADPAVPNAALTHCILSVNTGTHFTTSAGSNTYYVAERAIIKNSANLTDANSVVDFGPDSSTTFSQKISTSIADPINEALYVENSNASGNVAVFKGAAAEPALTVTSNGTVEVGTSITPAQLITQGTLEVHGNAIISSAANSVIPALATQGTLEVLGNATVSAINSAMPAMYIDNTAGVNPGLTVNGGTSLLSASNTLPALYVTYDYTDPGAINTHMYGGAFVDSLTVNDLYITTNLVTPWVDTFIVGPGGDYSDIDELAAASGYPGSFADCLIILTPGVHTPSGFFSTPAGSTIKGMDRYLSVISANNAPGPIVSLGDGSTLRNLTVMNTATTGNAWAVSIGVDGEIFNCDIISDGSASAVAANITAATGAKIYDSTISALNGIAGILLNDDSFEANNTVINSGGTAIKVSSAVTSGAKFDFKNCEIRTLSSTNSAIYHTKGTMNIYDSRIEIINAGNVNSPIMFESANIASTVNMGCTMLSAANATVPYVFDAVANYSPMPRVTLRSTVTNMGQWVNEMNIQTDNPNSMPGAFTSFEGAGPVIPWIIGRHAAPDSNIVNVSISGGGIFNQAGAETIGNWTVVDGSGTGLDTISSITYIDDKTISITFTSVPSNSGIITLKASAAAFTSATSDSNIADVFILFTMS